MADEETLPFINASSFEDMKTNLEKMLYKADFVQSPNINETAIYSGTGGWKIHIGIGIKDYKNKDEMSNVVFVFHQVIDLLEKYKDHVGFKLAGLDNLIGMSYQNSQRGKQITIYVPEEFEGLVPIISRHVEQIIDDNRENLYLVGSDPRINVPLDENGVISVRWSSKFAPRTSAEYSTDNYERTSDIGPLLKKRGKEDKMEDILYTFRELEHAKYLDRGSVDSYLKRGEVNRLKGNIVAVKEGGGYYAHLIEDVTYKGGCPYLKMRALEGPDIGKIEERDSSYLLSISRTQGKMLNRYEHVISLIIVIPLAFFLMLVNSFTNSQTTGLSILSKFYVNFLFTPIVIAFFIILFFILHSKLARKTKIQTNAN